MIGVPFDFKCGTAMFASRVVMTEFSFFLQTDSLKRAVTAIPHERRRILGDSEQLTRRAGRPGPKPQLTVNTNVGTSGTSATRQGAHSPAPAPAPAPASAGSSPPESGVGV